jgi:hypothetical protein
MSNEEGMSDKVVASADGSGGNRMTYYFIESWVIFGSSHGTVLHVQWCILISRRGVAKC